MIPSPPRSMAWPLPLTQVGRSPFEPRQRAVVVVGGLVAGGQPLAFIEGIVSLQARFGAGRRAC